MILDIMDVNRMVRLNNLRPVTAVLFFNESGVPDPNGLFSYEIFGLPGSAERKLRPAYIELDGPYLHPNAYKILVSIDRKIADVISGEDYYIFNEKTKYFEKATEESDDMDTGLSFLYKYWDDFVFRDGDSRKRNEKLELLKILKKDEVFMTKQFVIPAYLRDMNFESHSTSDINKLYKKIISSVNIITSMGKSSFSYNITRSIIQNTINEVYEYFTNLMRLKNGFLHQAVMGKNIDYGVRTLISAPSFNANTWKELPADFTHAAVPLAQCISQFTIHMQSWIDAWVEGKIMGRSNLLTYDMKTKTIVRKDLDPNWKDDFSPDNIVKKINLYISTPDSRFYPVNIRFADGSYAPFAFINDNKDLILESGQVDPEKLKNVRYFTWTDLFYLGAFDVCKDNHILVTRYPITGHHSEYFAGINVRSTFKTMKMLIGDKVYDQYPVVRLDVEAQKIESLFIDSLEIFPPYIGPLGADHDGDQVTSRALYSKEANDFAEKYLNSPANVIGLGGRSARKQGDVATHAMYNLLRNPDVVA